MSLLSMHINLMVMKDMDIMTHMDKVTVHMVMDTGIMNKVIFHM